MNLVNFDFTADGIPYSGQATVDLDSLGRTDLELVSIPAEDYQVRLYLFLESTVLGVNIDLTPVTIFELPAPALYALAEALANRLIKRTVLN